MSRLAQAQEASQLTPRSKFILDKLTIAQLFNKFPPFMKARGSLPCLQELATLSYAEQNDSSPHLYISFL
jgi:hypothetical protein